jgi:hypothetical protein
MTSVIVEPWRSYHSGDPITKDGQDNSREAVIHRKYSASVLVRQLSLALSVALTTTRGESSFDSPSAGPRRTEVSVLLGYNEVSYRGTHYPVTLRHITWRRLSSEAASCNK